MSAEDYQDFCMEAHAIRVYRQEKREASARAAENRSSSRRLLLDLLRSTGPVCVDYNGEVWKASVQRRQRTCRLPWDAVEQRLSSLWSDGLSEFRAAIAREEATGKDIVDAILDYCVPEDMRVLETTESLQVKREDEMSDVGKCDEVIERLVKVYVDSRGDLQQCNDRARSLLSGAVERRNAAEERILESVRSETATRTLQRVSVGCEAARVDYYLRVKPSSAAKSRRSVTVASLRAALSKLVSRELRLDGLTGERAVKHFCEEATGQKLLGALRQRFVAPAPRCKLQLDRVRRSDDAQ